MPSSCIRNIKKRVLWQIRISRFEQKAVSLVENVVSRSVLPYLSRNKKLFCNERERHVYDVGTADGLFIWSNLGSYCRE